MEADREVGDFLLRACHDLRSPARAVRTHSELFLRDAGETAESAVQQRLSFIVDGTRKIDTLLDGIASYAVALQTNPATFQAARMDLLLRLVLTKMAGPLRELGAEVIYGELPTVTANADRLTQVLENLLRNSLEFRGEAAPRIEISARREGDNWLLTVSDNGAGLEADSLDSIFRPFERLAGKGAGLGLAICRVIVERHGGRIWAEPATNGATFCFTLPV